MAGKIFVNYRRDDSASQALNVAQYLENTFGKARIFIDVDRLRAVNEAWEARRNAILLKIKTKDGGSVFIAVQIGPGSNDR